MSTPLPPDPYSASAQLSAIGSTGNQVQGNALGASMMTINTSALNVSSEATGGLFGYSGAPTSGSLFFSVSPASGTDPYGNTFPTGISVTQGAMSGIAMTGVSLDSTSILTGSSLNNGIITQPTMQGGTATSVLQILNPNGGYVLSYTSSTATTSFTAPGSFLWTVPSNITQVYMQCWGAGAGGGGGSTSQGGEGGGGGEYAAEPALAVTPNAVYTINVGQGGTGAQTGNAGSSGTDTYVQDQNFNTLCYAHAGQAGSNGAGGEGGVGSSDTVEEPGGNGGSSSGNSGGNGGGGAGGSTQQGGTGATATSSTGGAGGTGGATGGGAGGAGGNSGANGSSGSAPGGGGGGAGEGTSSGAVTETWFPADTYSYYNSGSLRNTNGNMYHGSPNSDFWEYSYISWGTGSLGNNLGVILGGGGGTVNAVSFRLTNEHSWYSDGMTWGLHGSNTLGGGEGTYSVLLTSAFITEGNTFAYNLSSGTWTTLASQTYWVLAPNSSNLFNVNWYGYFWGGPASGGGNQSFMPRVQVNYGSGGGGSFTAGNGANGQVVITYGSSANLVGAVSPQVGVDSLGNGFQPGVTALQHNILAATNPPATTAATGMLYANANATASVLNPSGLIGQIATTQSDVTQNTLGNSTVPTSISKLWIIPANDATVGTEYMLECPFTGTWGNPGGTLEIGIMKNGVDTNLVPVGGIAATHNVAGNVRLHMKCITNGGSGTFHVWTEGTMADATVTRVPGSIATLNGMSTTYSFSTIVANTVSVEAFWNGISATAPTLVGQNSTFHRKGP